MKIEWKIIKEEGEFDFEKKKRKKKWFLTEI